MKVVIQRVKNSSVSVDGNLVSEINKGLNILVGIGVDDTLEDLEYLVRKIVNLRIFDDENGALAQMYTMDNAHVLGKYYSDWVDWILRHAR